MTDHQFMFNGTPLCATATGALWLQNSQTLTVSDMHFGKSERIARRAGTMLPPYETRDTLLRLQAEIARFNPITVICLGDSFDDMQAAQDLDHDAKAQIAQLQSGRHWIWIEGNHDAGPAGDGGTHLAQTTIENITFRHIATDAPHEVSGHYHPKHRINGAGPARACFLYDKNRLILPAFGTYTGGLNTKSDVITSLFPDGGIAVLTGVKATPVPIQNIPRPKAARGRFY